MKMGLRKKGKQALREIGFPNDVERWGNRNFSWENFDHSMLLPC